jgi:predicted negative regulator of RcsB-dependent stress response
VGETFARARQLCEQLNRQQQLRPVLAGQYRFRLVRGALDQAEHHADEIRHLGETENEVRWQRTGSIASGSICMYRGKFVDARAHFEKLDSWGSREGRLAAGHFARTLLYLGYADQARLWIDQVLATARQLAPADQVYARWAAWVIYREIEGLKSAPTMLRWAEELLRISTERGFNMQFGAGNIMRGWCLGAVGRAAEGISSVLQGIEIWRATDAKLEIPFHLVTLAEIYGIAAQPEEGLNQLNEAAKLVEATRERWAEAEMHRLRGALLLSMHDHTAAEDSYRHALAVARRQSAKFWELRAALDLARLWRDKGKRNEARNLLAPVYNWFTEGFDTPVLQEAKALLDELA